MSGLALWSHNDPPAVDPLALWAGWADNVRGASVAAGHFLPEEAPGETAQELGRFFAGD